MKNLPYLAALVAGVFCFPSSIWGQWGHAPDVQTPVSTLAPAAVFDTRVLSDGSGGLFVTWEDRRNSDTSADIYAQKLGSDGRQQWTENGVEVCRFESLQDLPLIVADGAGGCIIVWLDHRIFDDGRTHVFAQRFDADGNALWTANGIRVCTNDDDQDTVSVVTRAGGGAVVAWSDQRADPGSRHIYAQALDLNGNRLLTDSGLAVATDDLPHLDITAVPVAGNDTMVLWRGNFSVIKAVLLSDPSTVINAFPDNSGTRGLKAIPDGAGGVIAGVFRFFETSGDVGVWVQRISSGLAVQWGAGGVLLSPNTADDPFSEITLASDGAGGAYVAWHTEPGNNMNVYAHRVAGNGTPLWTANGITVADDPEDEESPALLADDEGVTIFWRANDDQALRAQRFDTDGVAQWTEAADVVIEEGIQSVREFGLVPDDSGGVIAGFSMFPVGGNLDVLAKRLLADGTLPQSRLINISTRAFVGTGAEQLIAGFVIVGTGTKRLLIRGVGPRLGEDPFNIDGILTDPMITLHGSGGPIEDNDNWGDNANVADIETVSGEVFAFPLETGSNDAALLVELPPGIYTVILGGVGGGTGVGLIEVYDTQRDLTNARLVNVSSRGFAGTNSEVIIPGFVISGNATMRVLVRGVGESLGTILGVPGVVNDTMFEVRNNQTGALIDSNDNWWTDVDNRNAANAHMAHTGAFQLPDDSPDAAKVIILGPGLYTAVVSGVDSTTGVCLVEAYESF